MIFTRVFLTIGTLSAAHHVCIDAFSNARISRPNLQLTATIEASAQSLEDAITPKHLLPQHERASIESLVNERSQARWQGNYKRADEIRSAIDCITVGIKWRTILECTNTTLDREDLMIGDLDDVQNFTVIITDVPRSEGGQSSWELIPCTEGKSMPTEDNVLQLAHAALGMVVSMSDQGLSVKDYEFNDLIAKAIARLKILSRRKAIAKFLSGAACELHGRKAADAALWFALAGVTNDVKSDIRLYDELINIATDELIRFGGNKSCRSKDILHIVERIAMSGSVGPSVQRLYTVAANFLEEKTSHCDSEEEANENDVDYHSIIKSLRDSSFGLHSNRSLLGLWRFSTRQRKQKAFFQHAATHYVTIKDDKKIGSIDENAMSEEETHDQYNWTNFFEDPTRPLVVDVGCGMGVSLLGLASNSKVGYTETSLQHNFIGVDLSRLGIRYADGICNKWNLRHCLKFVVDSAEQCLSNIRESYPGDVELIMIQFPTPFRFKASDAELAERGYNSQLPEDAACGSFMNLLSEVQRTLSKNGKLLIQSNCEDVAVHVMEIGVKVGLRASTFDKAVTRDDLADMGRNIPKRALDYDAGGGERAIGPHWSLLPILPDYGRTETEVACILDNKPVHRGTRYASSKWIARDSNVRLWTEWVPWLKRLVLKFENTFKFLRAQGCSDLLDRVKRLGFEVEHHRGAAGDVDLIGRRPDPNKE